MNILKPPTPLPHWSTIEEPIIFEPIIFLGGSIEMDGATLWQDRVIGSLSNENITILNPRRDNWDSSWAQDPTPGTPFHEQVTWELDGQDMADILVYYFDPNTKSPITLLELGMFVAEDTHVYCPKGFWRYGNVKILCARLNVIVHEDETNLIDAIRASIKEMEV